MIFYTVQRPHIALFIYLFFKTSIEEDFVLYLTKFSLHGYTHQKLYFSRATNTQLQSGRTEYTHIWNEMYVFCMNVCFACVCVWTLYMIFFFCEVLVSRREKRWGHQFGVFFYSICYFLFFCCFFSCMYIYFVHTWESLVFILSTNHIKEFSWLEL